MAGLSFIMSQSGSVMVEDCHWKDMTTVATLIAVGQNDYQSSSAGGFVEVPSRSSSLTLRNCHFENIVYDFPLIYSHDQIVVVENCTFKDIHISLLPELSCNNWRFGGCANAMTCLYDAACSISNSCFQNVETDGPGLLIFEKYENALVAGGAQNSMDMGTESFEATLLSYNNFLDVKSDVYVDCEMVVLGFNPHAQGDNQSGQDNFECHAGLAFQASQCLA